jgi:hypothetical protein
MPRKIENFDVVISIVPSIAAGYAGRFASRKFKVPLFLIVQDLSGVGVAQSGISDKKILNLTAIKVEENLLRAAKKVSCISEEISSYLKHRIPVDRVSFIPNYRLKSIPMLSKSAAREELGLPEDKFLIIHTGNMGMKQGLENLFPIAHELEKNSNVFFYLVGHGNQEKELANKAQNFSNIFVLPSVDDERYPSLLNSADVLLVCELETQKTMSLPSKIVSYSSVERPILALVPEDGATAKFLGKSSLIFNPFDKPGIVHAIYQLSTDEVFYRGCVQKSRLLKNKIFDRSKASALYSNWIDVP